MSVLVLVSGLNGTGKTSIGRALRARLGAADTMLVDQPLSEGTPVIVESVMSAGLRDELKASAHAAGARVYVVECVCSDERLHRERVEARASAVTWDHVLHNRGIYEPDDAPDYVADAVLPLEHHVDAIVAALSGMRGPGA